MKLYIMKVGDSKLMVCKLLRDVLGMSLKDAADLYTRVRDDGPQVAAEIPDDPHALQQLVYRLNSDEGGHVFAMLDPEPHELRHHAPEPDAEVQEADICARTTLVLMAIAGGNATFARQAARSLALNTGDALYDDVVGLLEAVFPVE